MSKGSSDAEKYRLAQEQQGVFRDAIKSCMEGNISDLNKILKEFLEKNKDYTAEEFFAGFQSEGRTLLHIAASSGRAPVFDFVLDNCKDAKKFANLKDHKGFTPIMNATIGESSAIIDSLLKLGADVNSRNNDGAAAIHFAAGDGSIARLNQLFAAGARLEDMSKSGSPLHWAAGKGRSEAIKFLIDKIQAAHGDKALDQINQGNQDGLPAVLLAAVASCDLGVSYLVEAGADIGMIVSGNLTVLHICAEHGLSVAVQSILRTEAGVKCCAVQTSEGNTPLQLAAMTEHKETVRILIPHSDLTYLNSGTTQYASKGVEATEAVVDSVLAEGVKRMAKWEEEHHVKSAESAADAENTVFTKMTSGASSETTVTPEQDAAAELHKENGNTHYKAGQYQLAIDAYTEALYLNKYNATYWSNRSACYLGLKEPTKALKDAEICRQLKPDWPRGCYRLASARLALGMYEDAAVAAFEGVKLDENNKELKALLQKAVKMGQEEHKAKIATGKC